MTTAENRLPHRLKLVALLTSAICFTLALHGQTSNTGAIQGRVYNPVSQEYVRNAEVRLEGTNQVTYTENDGTFRFNNVPGGETTISVIFTGYNPAKETFTVTPGQTATREINLTSTSSSPTREGAAVVKLDAFTVSTEREGNAKAIMEQRRNMDITTSVSSDIFGEITDGNVGEFLKYLPGVDLDYVESEARGPRLGGMDGQYVGVSFDGIRTASADANRGGDEASRATSFEGFAITSIESIEISRTTSADSDADSPAGTINMKTKRAFDHKGRRLGYNFSVNFNAEEFNLKKQLGPDERMNYKWKPNASLQYSESFLNQRVGVLLGISRANSYTEQYSLSMGQNRSPTAADPRPLVIRNLSFKDGPKWILKDAMTLTVDVKATQNLTLSLTGIYTYTEGEFWNRVFNFVAANDNANVNNGRSRVGGDGVLTVIGTRAPSGSVDNVSTLNNESGSSSKLTYSRTFAPKFEYRLGRSVVIDGAFTFSKSVNDYEALERGFAESELGGVPSSWVATRPHERSWEWNIRQTSGNDWFDLNNFTRSNTRDGGTRVSNSGRRWITEIWNGQVNARWSVPFLRQFPTSLKFGGKWNEESRDNSDLNAWWVWSYVGPGGNTVTRNATTGAWQNATYGNWANLGYVAPHPFDMGTTNALTVVNINGVQGMPPRADRNRIADLFHARPDLFVHTAIPDNYYNTHVVNKRDFRQTVTAGYAQLDTRLTRKLQLRTGVRYENTLNQFKEVDPRFAPEITAAGFPVNAAGRATTFEGLEYQFFSKPKVTRESEYHNWFPSIAAKYRITPDLEFHTGFNKSISRPPINSLTGTWVIDEVNDRVTAPNANLMPEHAEKYHVRLAYYFRSRMPGQLSVDFSQVDIKNFRQTFDYSAEEFGVSDEEYSTYTFRSTRNSDEERRFRNMEIAYNQTLGFLPELFRRTSVNVAYTRSYANVRRNKLAPHRVSSRLAYAYRRFNGSLGMVWVDESPDSATYGRYNAARTQFDLTANWTLTKRATLYVQGRNITGKPVLWYNTPQGMEEGSSPILRQMQEYGANWVFGVRGTF